VALDRTLDLTKPRNQPRNQPRKQPSRSKRSSASGDEKKSRDSRRPKGKKREGEGETSARETLGAFLRAQRRFAGLTLRQLAEITSVSNAYLSQIERGHHKPSVDVLRAVARGLNVSAETILDQVGLFEDPDPNAGPGSSPAIPETEVAIRFDPKLTDDQREALLTVYRSYLSQNEE